ncbi:MAG: iron hydrogenase small subunit [Bacteroidales bacterium]|nr:iron hydrogenase small subunit [Bacteroidales bacterium]
MSEKQISLFIDGVEISVKDGSTILEAAKVAGVQIPTLCHHDDLCVAGNCRVCVVEVEGRPRLEASCATPAQEGMHIKTSSPKVRQARTDIVALLLSEHNSTCTSCYRNQNCELQTLSSEFNIDTEKYMDICEYEAIDKSSVSIQRDLSKCIRCLRCVRTCAEIQSVNAFTAANKGHEMKITTFMDLPLNDVVCSTCGQCINRCPVGALTEQRYYHNIWDAIGDPKKHVVVNTAPATRVVIGEGFGYGVGQRVTGKMVSALRRLGFDSVLDTDFTADLTIIEEGNELLQRLKKALVDKEEVALPMFTSCSPGWVKYLEHMYPELIPNLSTCKSPQQMFGALTKTYYADKVGINPEDIVSVSIMPCTAKKFEANRPEMRSSGYQDIDFGLTSRELIKMIQQAGIDFNNLPDSEYDSFMGKSTGAAVIFGATGGVMEAALRTVYEVVTGREIPFKNLDITPVRGFDSIKEASLIFENCLPAFSFLEGVEAKVAIAHGLSNAKILMEQVKAGKSPYHFVEIMACPGGCLGGGGQPIPTNEEIRTKRMKAIYEEDANMPIRKSHENPEIKEIYEEFLKEPLGHKSHELLHTHYRGRNRY